MTKSHSMPITPPSPPHTSTRSAKYRAPRNAMLVSSDTLIIPDWNNTLPVLNFCGLSEALMGIQKGGDVRCGFG